MAINAVNSATSSAQQLRQGNQQIQVQQAQAAKPADGETKARQAEANKSEQPKAVANTQGQKTGQIINVTA